MAIVFELVANFGDDEETAAQAAATVPDSVRVGSRVIDLYPPDLRRHELSVIPVAIGRGVARDRDVPWVALDRDELTELGHRFYDVLREMRGYQAAIVGWEPEAFVDLAELRTEWLDDITTGQLHGLVLSTEARHDLAPDAPFEPFAEGAEWLPYQGERAGNH